MSTVLEAIDHKIYQLQGKLERLREARAILVDEDFIEPVQDSPPPSARERVEPLPARPIDTSPLCAACDTGRLRPAVRIAPSGVYINMLQCDDGGCNNEVY